MHSWQRGCFSPPQNWNLSSGGGAQHQQKNPLKYIWNFWRHHHFSTCRAMICLTQTTTPFKSKVHFHWKLLGRQSKLLAGQQNKREQFPNFLINFPGLSFCSCPTLEKYTPKPFDVPATLPLLRKGTWSEHPNPMEEGCLISQFI